MHEATLGIPLPASGLHIFREHALSSQNVATMTFPSSEQAEAMRIALDMACKELGLREADEASRARVSSAITTLARAGQLKTYAVHRFRSLG